MVAYYRVSYVRPNGRPVLGFRRLDTDLLDVAWKFYKRKAEINSPGHVDFDCVQVHVFSPEFQVWKARRGYPPDDSVGMRKA